MVGLSQLSAADRGADGIFGRIYLRAQVNKSRLIAHPPSEAAIPTRSSVKGTSCHVHSQDGQSGPTGRPVRH
jgi:hypothetical protein